MPRTPRLVRTSRIQALDPSSRLDLLAGGTSLFGPRTSPESPSPPANFSSPLITPAVSRPTPNVAQPDPRHVALGALLHLECLTADMLTIVAAAVGYRCPEAITTIADTSLDAFENALADLHAAGGGSADTKGH